MDTTELLVTLVEREGDDVMAILHERVHFRQGDGTIHKGRDAVLALFQRSERDVRYTIVARAMGTVRVKLEVPDVPGSVSFLLCGRSEQQQLVEVWVEP
jgi:hypothetical protein